MQFDENQQLMHIIRNIMMRYDIPNFWEHQDIKVDKS